jgi:hypothetical protein
MTISYRLRKTELTAAAKYIAAKNASVRNQLLWTPIISAIAVAITIFFLGLSSWGRIRSADLAFAFVSAIIIYFVTGFLFRYSYIERFIKIASDGQSDFTRTITMSLEEDGIASTSDLGSGKLLWSALREIEEDDKYIYLALPSANVVVIPKTSFSDDKQAQDFFTAVSAHITA